MHYPDDKTSGGCPSSQGYSRCVVILLLVQSVAREEVDTGIIICDYENQKKCTPDMR